MDYSILRQYSLRIFSKINKQNIGSGVLYVPRGNCAYIFTAAHVLDKSSSSDFIVEFYNECSQSKKQDYTFELSKDDFVYHTLYKNPDSVAPFDKNDIAGAKIEKLPWMNETNIYFADAPDGSEVLYIGYPANSFDPEMPFAEKITKVSVKRNIDKRIQIEDGTQYTNIIDELKGVSGAGVWIYTDNDIPCFVGMITTVHGNDGTGGLLDGISTLPIKELCLENDWKCSQSTIIHKEQKDNKTVLIADIPEPDVSDIGEIVPSEPSSDKQALCMRLQKQIKSAVRDLQISEALNLCEELQQTSEQDNVMKRYCDFAALQKAYCYMLLAKWKEAAVLLKDCGDFDTEEQGLAYIMLSDLARNQGQEYYVKHFLQLAKYSQGERLQTAFYECYRIILSSETSYSDDDYNELFSLIRVSEVTSKEKEQLYKLLANICVIKYRQFDLAVKALRQGFAITGDKSFYLSIALCYFEKTFSDKKMPDIVSADLAYQNFEMYLNFSDEMLSEAFYKNYGLPFCDIIAVLANPIAMKKHIEMIIEQCQDEKILPQLFLNKAEAIFKNEGYSPECFENIPVQYQYPLKVYFAVQSVMQEYSLFLDEKSVFLFEKEKDRTINPSQEDYITLKEKQIVQQMRALADEIEIIVEDRNPDYKFLIEKLSCSLLTIYLNLKEGEKFEKYLAFCKKEYPENIDLFNMELLCDEAKGNISETEEKLLQKIEEESSPQALKELQNFYFRNCQYTKLLNFYRGFIEGSSEAEKYFRKTIIVQYLEVLAKSVINLELAKKEFENFKTELNTESISYLTEIIKDV